MDVLIDKYRDRLEELSAQSVAYATETDGWKVSKTSKGVTMLRKRKEFGELDLMKAHTVIKLPTESVVALLGDHTLIPKFNKQTKKVTVLGEEIPYKFVHVETNPVLVIKGRHLFNIQITKKLENNTHIIVATSVDDEDAPNQDTGVVGYVHLTAFHIAPHEDDPTLSVVTFVSCADPRGKIPHKVVNSAISKSCSVLRGLHEHVEKGRKDGES